MKKTLLKTICMALVAILCIGSLNAQCVKKAPESKLRFATVAASFPTPSRSVIYSEDFEGTADNEFGTACTPSGGGDPLPYAAGPLPTGWTVSTTGKWKSYSDQDLMECVSGTVPHNGARMMGASWINSGNNWAFSAGFTLESGISYDIKFWYSAMGWSNPAEPDKFEVRIGTTATAGGMSGADLVFSQTELIGDSEYLEAAKTFTPSANGTYYLGFHDLRGSQYGFAILIDDITITEKGAVTFCDPVTNLQAEIQGKDVRLTWTAAPGNPTNYKIYNGTASVGTTTNTDYVVTNLPVGAATLGVEAIYGDDCEPVKVSTTVEMPLLLNPIKNLNGSCIDGTLNLTWTKPDDNETGYNNWLTYSTSDYKGGVGIPNQAINVYWAQRWSPADLAALGITTGSTVTKMKFVFSSWTGHEITDATYKLKIWQGTSSTSAGTEKMSQDVPFETLIEGDWNEFTLSTPLAIDASLELWIGIHSNVISLNGNPVATDDGPNVPDVNLFRTNSPTGAWTKAESITGLNSNWMVAGWVISEGGDPIELAHYNVYQDNVKLGETTTPTYTKADMDGQHNYCVLAVYNNDAQSVKVCKAVNCACEPPTNLKVEYESACSVAKLTWTVPDAGLEYKVYRGENFLEQVTTNTYTDTEFGENATWSVKTVCGAKESEAISVTKPCGGVKENAKAAFSIVPNPAASGNITITSGNNFNKIEMISFLGQTVLSQPNTGSTATIDVSNLPNGVYFVRIISDKGVNVQKFVKQ